MGPPEGPRVRGSLRVRSPLMMSNDWPSLVDRNSTFAPTYSTFGSCGEITIGKVHWNRSVMSMDEYPMGLFG